LDEEVGVGIFTINIKTEQWEPYDLFYIPVAEWLYHDPVYFAMDKVVKAYGTLYHDARKKQIAYDGFLDWTVELLPSRHRFCYAYRDGEEWAEVKQELNERKSRALTATYQFR
jgi:hypothetical protein